MCVCATSKNEYLQVMMDELNHFKQNVSKNAKEPLQAILNKRFFDSVRSDLCAIDDDSWANTSTDYFVFWWLHEEQAFQRINTSLAEVYRDPSFRQRKTSLRNKVNRLTNGSFDATAATAFELELLSLFHADKTLREIEVSVAEDSKKNADFSVSIVNREIIVEATSFNRERQDPKCYHPAIVRKSEHIQTSVGTGDLRAMKLMVEQKIKGKMSEQLHPINGPLILVIYNSVPIDNRIIQGILETTFQEAKGSNSLKGLSAVATTSGYTVPGLTCFENPNAKYQLTKAETDYFNRKLLHQR
jgi:hypothetical protein